MKKKKKNQRCKHRKVTNCRNIMREREREKKVVFGSTYVNSPIHIRQDTSKAERERKKVKVLASKQAFILNPK